jgi:hypothetical protein
MDDTTPIMFSELTNREMLKNYLFSSERRLHAVNFLVKYCRIGTLIKTLSTGKWRIGSPLKMNDKKELSDFPSPIWRKMFYSCFIADSTESIAMWSLYSRPWSDGISIRIDKDTFWDWIYKVKKIYTLNCDGDYQEIDGGRISVVRVAYTNELTKNAAEKISIRCGAEENTHIDNIFAEDNDYSTGQFAGVIKDLAWSYENEVRIRIDFDSEVDVEGVYIDVPDFVVEKLVITAGPLFYGNLECRLAGYNQKVSALTYSSFSGLLKDMPCENYTNMKGSACDEIASLVNAKKLVPNADKLILSQCQGRGTFHFDNIGSMIIGSGEYAFKISWHQCYDDLVIETEAGVSQAQEAFLSPSSISYGSPFGKNINIKSASVFLIRNANDRVTAIKLLKDESEPNLYQMEYKVFMDVSLHIYDKNEYHGIYGKLESGSDEELDEICGVWGDLKSKRCHMLICKKNGVHFGEINWASSASINSKWTFSGIWNAIKEEMIFNNEKEVTETYREDGTVEVLTRYDNGTGRIYIENSFLYWDDFLGTTGKRCKFEKIPSM